MTPEILRYRAFTANGTGGNPAGIVFNAGRLRVEDRIAIADDTGYSETAFIDDETDGPSRRIRFYSPRAEIKMCGHATLGTAFALADREGPATYSFDTAIGTVTVAVEPAPDGADAWYGSLAGVPALSAPAADSAVRAALDLLGWSLEDLDSDYPPHILQPGNKHLLLAVGSETHLMNLRYEHDALKALMNEKGWATIHIIQARTSTTFNVRAPFPTGGLFEDAATGSAAVAFGAYLRDIGAITPPADIVSYQGQYMHRPCRLVTSVAEHAGAITVGGTGGVLP